MDDFNDDLYFERKKFWNAKLEELYNQVDQNSAEDLDAFMNAVDDF